MSVHKENHWTMLHIATTHSKILSRSSVMSNSRVFVRDIMQVIVICEQIIVSEW